MWSDLTWAKKDSVKCPDEELRINATKGTISAPILGPNDLKCKFLLGYFAEVRYGEI